MTDIASPSLAMNEFPPPGLLDSARLTLAGRGNAWLRGQERLKKKVYRLHYEVGGRPVSLVVKRLPQARARAVQLAAQRWLPAAGLARACPRLHGVMEEPGKGGVWHLYEDVHGKHLDSRSPDPARVELVVELIAEVHTSFTSDALLEECRATAGDLGITFFDSQVAASVRYLKSLLPVAMPGDIELTHRLLERMERIYDSRVERSQMLAASGESDTLLHGDLWTTNTIVTESGHHRMARLIDWDRTGVGPAVYDVSTFLLRFAPQDRGWILGLYRAALLRRGRSLPNVSALNRLFETAEFARYACCLAEAAGAAAGGERWGFEQMAAVEGWFRLWDSSPPLAEAK
jgi:aminoglycoside phosphotransferase (APT) family kinase protein